MPLLDSLERRFRFLAFPGLLRVVAMFQVAVFVMLYFKPEMIQTLILDWDQVLKGQVWRLLSFFLIPSSQHIIWIIFSTLILVMIGDSLEAEWGAFRVTVYFFGTVAALALGTWLSDDVARRLIVPLFTASYLYLSIFLAFSVTFPRAIFNLFGILPVEARWLGWIDAAYLAYDFFRLPSNRICILVMLIPFALMVGPVLLRSLRQKGRVVNRRARLAADSLPADEYFFKCVVCNRSDVTDPELEFRVAADGEEYCTDHMPGVPKQGD